MKDTVAPLLVSTWYHQYFLFQNSDRSVVGSHRGVICIFLMANDVEHNDVLYGVLNFYKYLFKHLNESSQVQGDVVQGIKGQYCIHLEKTVKYNYTNAESKQFKTKKKKTGW